jgi:hypothetical protein
MRRSSHRVLRRLGMIPSLAVIRSTARQVAAHRVHPAPPRTRAPAGVVLRVTRARWVSSVSPRARAVARRSHWSLLQPLTLHMGGINLHGSRPPVSDARTWPGRFCCHGTSCLAGRWLQWSYMHSATCMGGSEPGNSPRKMRPRCPLT